MSIYQNVMTMEEGAESEFEYAKSVQGVINAGQWGLQGSFGRTMMDYIEAGMCMLGTEGERDYYGNYIPSRDEVQAGTKGSYEYVAERYGEGWADEMAEVGV